jgi:hypothetical protein
VQKAEGKRHQNCDQKSASDRVAMKCGHGYSLPGQVTCLSSKVYHHTM